MGQEEVCEVTWETDQGMGLWPEHCGSVMEPAQGEVGLLCPFHIFEVYKGQRRVGRHFQASPRGAAGWGWEEEGFAERVD